MRIDGVRSDGTATAAPSAERRDEDLRLRAAMRRVWCVVGIGGVLAALATAMSVIPRTPSPRGLLTAGILCLVVAVAERWAVLTVRTDGQVSNLTLSEVPLIIGLFVLPGHGILLVLARTVGSAIAMQVLQRQELHKSAFNVVYLWLETLLALAIFTAIAPDGITDGLRVSAAVGIVAVAVAVCGAVALAVASAAMEGRWRLHVTAAAIRDHLVPSLAASAVAVVTLALADASPALLWAPSAIVVMILLAYRAHVHLRTADAMQRKLRALTHQVTGEDDLRTTAEQICEAIRSLMDAPAAAIRIVDACGTTTEWVGAHGTDAREMEHRLAVELAGGDHRSCCSEGSTTTLFAPVGSIDGCWVGVSLDARTVDAQDRSSVTLIANHAAVALTNARRGQALVEQATAARHQAMHDSLTGLPNRAHLLASIREAIQEDVPFGLLLIDLDDFKEINDALGHPVGDTVLTEVAARLGPAGDRARVVARLGGDEFAAVVTGDAAGCQGFATRLRDAIARPVTVGPYTIQVASSLGIALYPSHGADEDELLKNADLAMYEAKRAGRGTSVFGTGDGERAVRHLAISSELRSALQQGDITVAFQPQLDLRSGDLVAVEALARWSHPELGPIGPDEFVRVAEQSGLISELTFHVLGTALAWQRTWAAAGVDVSVAVNVSARSLVDAALPSHTARLLEEHGVPAERLTLELTEWSVISDPTRSMAVLHRLSALGVSLSIDDFGTGYSSLAYLRQLPADEVKIDKSFILPMLEEPTATDVVSGIVRLCHDLGYRVVAEGVETGALQSVLRRLACDRGQGYHIARPMPAVDVLEWSRQRRRQTQVGERTTRC